MEFPFSPFSTPPLDLHSTHNTITQQNTEEPTLYRFHNAAAVMAGFDRAKSTNMYKKFLPSPIYQEKQNRTCVLVLMYLWKIN